MFKTLSVILAVTFSLAAGLAQAEDKRATVLSMMDKAVTHFNSVGQDQAFKDFAVKESDYFRGEMYIFSIMMDTGILNFHAANPKLEDKDLTKLQDTDGKLFVAAMWDTCRDNKEGWVDYKWPNPETKKIAQKHTFVKTVGDNCLSIGYYD